MENTDLILNWVPFKISNNFKNHCVEIKQQERLPHPLFHVPAIYFVRYLKPFNFLTTALSNEKQDVPSITDLLFS